MRPFTFHTSIEEGVFTYRYVSPVEGVIEKRWAGWGDFAAWADADDTPHYDDFNVINHNGRAEELALYLGLVWRLSHGLCRYGIPCFFRDDAAKKLRKPYDRVKWEYDTEAEVTQENWRRPENFVQDHGFVRAQSQASYPDPTPAEEAHRYEAGLFAIDAFASFADMQKVTLYDARSQVNIFCLSEQRKDDLLMALRADTRPTMQDILKTGELFIDLLVGMDMGFFDAITVKSVVDITPRLNAVLADFRQAILAFEARIVNIRSDDLVGYRDTLEILAFHPNRPSAN